ncbi:L-seryl-tRNA(Sec) selenium transferase, partial [Desulfobacterales bacterium HSG16]|nr:L-seryl-tRNA(Sec) selenium transferase [Desulfobacterales bacterium HSG16]
MEKVRACVDIAMAPNLKPVINATGVVVHTNLGRSVLADDAIQNMAEIAGSYSNLEFDLDQGRRGSRYSAVEDLLCELTGADAAMVVNNNAAAVLLCLDTIAKDKQVIISRGELVEIGGSFRIPDVMAKSGAILKEVGATNRTHLKDYISAINEQTGLLLKVHTSNYTVVGFTASVSLKELAALGKERNIPVMEDLGSGTFIDFSSYGMIREPTVIDSVEAGIDLITFSGDKLLGGPQTGIIIGRADILNRIKQNPLTRALRIDKLTLAALESTLRLYRDPAEAVMKIPTLRMLTRNIEQTELKANILMEVMADINNPRLHIKQIRGISRVGGGALPLEEIPAVCIAVTVEGMSTNAIQTAMRKQSPPIIGRIENDTFILDLRTTSDEDIPAIARAFSMLLER